VHLLKYINKIRDEIQAGHAELGGENCTVKIRSMKAIGAKTCYEEHRA
jgi:hypothetical protein